MKKKIVIHGYIDKGYCGQEALVECSIRNGFPGFDITGLPGTSIKEARERVRCALRTSGFKFPQNRILINLSPASQPKDSTLLDLPLAVAIALGSIGNDSRNEYEDPEELHVMIAGEITLSGQILEAPQALGAIEAARKARCKVCIVPFQGSDSIDDMLMIRAENLLQVFHVCKGLRDGNDLELASLKSHVPVQETIFGDVIGLSKEKDILAMAASGFHSTLIFGPPGVGKTMLSTRMHLLLPELDSRQLDETARILGCADLAGASDATDTGKRMRILSHDCTQTQFISGPSSRQPGEGALAHCRTLVLDEVNKFTPKLLETVKDSYDRGLTQSSRSGEVITYPSRFLMVANMNPCPCGGLGKENMVCTCTAQKLDSHWRKVGRQFIERFDIRLPVRGDNDIMAQLEEDRKPDSWYLEKSRISADRQRVRYKYIDNIRYNGEVHYDIAALSLLRNEIALFNSLENIKDTSARNQIGLVTLARTIADYNDCDVVTKEHFMAARELRQYGLGDYYWRTLV